MAQNKRNGHTMYEAIVFDLDGTLLNTLDDLAAATNAALRAFALPERTREEVRSFVGNGIVKLLERAVGDRAFARFSELLGFFKEYYGTHCADYTRPYEGILPLLRTLQARGVKTAVLSNKADFAVKKLTEQYFGDLLLDAVGENEEGGIRKKPAPDALFSVMERLGVTRETTVYVGDSEVDIQTAKNAGVDHICVTWGFRERVFLGQNGGEVFVDDPVQILDFCKE